MTDERDPIEELRDACRGLGVALREGALHDISGIIRWWRRLKQSFR